MNLGLEKMAVSCPFTYRQLSWSIDWHIREETLLAADCIFCHDFSAASHRASGWLETVAQCIRLEKPNNAGLHFMTASRISPLVQRHLSPLSALQQQILAFCDFSPTIST